MVIEIILAIIVLVVIFWLLQGYVVPAMPYPFGRVLMAVAALLVILLLCSYFFGWAGFGFPHYRR